MVNALLILALAVVVGITVLGARALYRLHHRCRCVENSPKADSGLLRWYAEGFERPLHLASWLLRVQGLLIAIALLTHAHPLVVAAAVVALAATSLELHIGRLSERRHQRAAAFLYAAHGHRDDA
jgi:hypothetical protein